MSNTSESLNNYFSASQNFMNTYMEALQKMAPSEDYNPKLSKFADDYKALMQDMMSSIQNNTEQQIQQMANMSDEQIQSSTLQGLEKFQENFQSTSNAILSAVRQTQDYISSEQFLQDVEKSKATANTLYSGALNGMARVLDTYSDFLQNMPKNK